ncbi:HD domain-containing phosphohydrolase [Fibrobacter sp. UBA4297]|uniref:HD-GYP domain-containing protein n=1 Tax=Fibrobacter sp. UBA4297 TaxID=1946536 RepID=UPI0025C47A7E|nr:HD domain-containing phosphohydrolase [Fibrobacter sp. UBA4297]
MDERRPLILIVDDVAVNRALLSDILSDKYNIIEAENGNEALLLLREKTSEISLVLLDMVMPEKDGMEVLAIMNKNGWINEIPVIMISAETAHALVEGAYMFGVTDFIGRPFDEMVLKNRVNNTIRLYNKQKSLSDLVLNQIYEKTRNNSMMVTMLSHIVEFRNGESGMHVLHINTITEMLLRELLHRSTKYNINKNDIGIICTASSMHDIGKITIPDEILNKPGKLTTEEFNIMKNHTVNSARMLNAVPFGKDELLMKYAYEICRWHHERWDGRGYPDGLKGDEIPISAQIVSIADVYDALTSERCYKHAFTHEKALEMIHNNECGVFNPLLIECLDAIADKLVISLQTFDWSKQADKDFFYIADAMMTDQKHPIYNQAFRQFIDERKKSHFYESMLDGILFEYTTNPTVMKLSAKAAAKLGLPRTIVDDYKPGEDATSATENLERIKKILRRQTTPKDKPTISKQVFNIDGKKTPCNVKVLPIWTKGSNEEPVLTSVYGHIDVTH